MGNELLYMNGGRPPFGMNGAALPPTPTAPTFAAANAMFPGMQYMAPSVAPPPTAAAAFVLPAAAPTVPQPPNRSAGGLAAYGLRLPRSQAHRMITFRDLCDAASLDLSQSLFASHGIAAVGGDNNPGPAVRPSVSAAAAPSSLSTRHTPKSVFASGGRDELCSSGFRRSIVDRASIPTPSDTSRVAAEGSSAIGAHSSADTADETAKRRRRQRAEEVSGRLARTPCAPVLTKPDYYTYPPLNILEMMPEEGLEAVENFEVGRRGYGSIKFLVRRGCCC